MNNMKDRSIILKEHEVQAILKGESKQIRRPMRYTHPVVIGFEPNGPHGYWKGIAKTEAVERQYISTFPYMIKFPYGVVGRRLWVRESWGMTYIHVVPKGHPRKVAGTWGVPAYPHFKPCVIYKADGPIPLKPYWNGRYAPPMHMGREYSRLLLVITGIRVERSTDESSKWPWEWVIDFDVVENTATN